MLRRLETTTMMTWPVAVALAVAVENLTQRTSTMIRTFLTRDPLPIAETPVNATFPSHQANLRWTAENKQRPFQAGGAPRISP